MSIGTSDREAILKATRCWAEACADLTPETLDRLTALAASDIRFKDPFNDVTGHAALTRIFADMYETCRDPRFEVIDVAASERTGYIRWIFRFRPKVLKRGPEWRIDGMSEISVGLDGLITAHLDHWDSGAQLLARLPVLGAIVRRVMRRFSVGAG